MQESDLSNLCTEKPHLSDAVTFYGDIAPHRLLHLYAGVGAGKNKLIEKMMTGCPEEGIPRQTVLLITSRKSKVTEMLSKYPKYVFGKLCDDHKYFEILTEAPLPVEYYEHPMQVGDLDYTITQRSVICTNAAIEKYLQHCHDPTNPFTHLWNRFDIIVWDEVHSLGLDSSYQSAPYHIMRLFQETYRMMRKAEKGEIDSATGIPRCKNLIMMTGTHEAIDEISMPAETHYLNMLDICRSVSPANVHFPDTQHALEQIKEQLASGERIVYFANHVPSVDALAKTFGINKAQIAISFSDDDRRKEFKKRCDAEAQNDNLGTETDYERMVNVEEYLANKSCIRPDINLFVTTSRNKEGIDINDTDIHHVYVESHCLTDIRQMAGRIRRGAEHLYVITDSAGYTNSEVYRERFFDKNLCTLKMWDDSSKPTEIHPLDEVLNIHCRQFGVRGLVGNKNSSIRAYNKDHPEIGKFIDSIKYKLPYIEYDYFTNQFCYNQYREHARDFIAREVKEFSVAQQSPTRLSEMFRKVFPQTQIHLPIIPQEEAARIMERYIAEHPNGLISRAEREQLILEIACALNRNYDPASGKQPKINRWLSPIGYQIIQKGHNKDRSSYDVFEIIQLAADASDVA